MLPSAFWLGGKRTAARGEGRAGGGPRASSPRASWVKMASRQQTFAGASPCPLRMRSKWSAHSASERRAASLAVQLLLTSPEGTGRQRRTRPGTALCTGLAHGSAAPVSVSPRHLCTRLHPQQAFYSPYALAVFMSWRWARTQSAPAGCSRGPARMGASASGGCSWRSIRLFGCSGCQPGSVRASVLCPGRERTAWNRMPRRPSPPRR